MTKGFRIGVSKTVNLGNYQAIRVEAQIDVELLEGEDPVQAKHLAQLELRSLLAETYKAQKKGEYGE